MSDIEHLEQQKTTENGDPSSILADAIATANSTVLHQEHRSNTLAQDIEGIPNSKEKESFTQRAGQLDAIRNEAQESITAASFLDAVANYTVEEPQIAEDAPISQEINQPEQSPSIPVPSVNQMNVALEAIKGIANVVIEKEKEQATKVIKGVDGNGQEVEAGKRIEAAVGMIPKNMPKIGNPAFIIGKVLELQEEIKRAEPGFERSVLSKIVLLVADVPTRGLVSMAWEILKKVQEVTNAGQESTEVEKEPAEHQR